MENDQAYRRLGLNPATNPAILATSTWDPARAWRQVQEVGDQWRIGLGALRAKSGWSASNGTRVHSASAAGRGAALFCLAGLADGQEVLLEFGRGGGGQALGEPLGVLRLGDGLSLSAYVTDASVVDRYLRLLAPEKGPRPLGATPRLGIGCRMTTAVWPGVFQAMSGHGFAANPIQNSVRELSLLDDVLAGRPPERNYACGFGTIESGYTGSTYEGLWLAGVLAALREEATLRYGADADHLQVKRGPDGRVRARKLIEAARYYTFFTMDMADILRYDALDGIADMGFSGAACRRPGRAQSHSCAPSCAIPGGESLVRPER